MSAPESHPTTSRHEPIATPTVYAIEGLAGTDSAEQLEETIRALPGVAAASVAWVTSRLYVTAEPGAQPHEALLRAAALRGIVLRPVGARPPAHSSLAAWLRRHRQAMATIVSALLLASALALQWTGATEAAVWPFVAAIVVGGASLARAGWINLVTNRSLDMNALMAIAAVGAIIVGEYAEGAITVLLFSLGELVEAHSLDRARHAIRSLMNLAPTEATVLRDGSEARLPVHEIGVGERVLVRPGERLPLDGVIVSGTSAINQAPITGESLPVERTAGQAVYAGTINGSGALIVEVTRPAQESTLSRIMRLVERAHARRAPAERFVDRFARAYTPTVIALAALVAVLPPLAGLGPLSTWFYRALVMLVIACPCALVISTPVTIVSALARAARSGVLIKGGRYLEQIARVRAIAFDKTGTLTEGRPYVVAGGCVEQGPGDCAQCDDLLAKAAAVERMSEHALARAVTHHAERAGLAGRYDAGQEVTAIAGLGIEGLVDGHSVIVGSRALCRQDDGLPDPLCPLVQEEERKGRTVLIVEDACCERRCYLAVADRLRPDAADSIAALHRIGIEHTIILTGDNPFIAGEIARQAGLREVRASLMPADKVAAVAELERQYEAVAMVGDGVNDAPALARASVGIAMGAAGSDTALETADIALMGDDLSRLPYLIGLSRRALALVRANIALALGLKLAFMALAAAGVATLWMAVLADTGASLLVTLNGMRILRHRDIQRS